MHPGIPTQLPLLLTLLDRASGRPSAQFELNTNDIGVSTCNGHERREAYLGDRVEEAEKAISRAICVSIRIKRRLGEVFAL